MPLHVLIVDDNRDFADSLATLIILWGHTVSVAYDGEEGLRAARKSVPDCLILDINMPRMDGYTVAEHVRREAGLAGAKLVAVSAYSDATHVRRAVEAGFDYRLTKPADPAELERLLKMIEHIAKLAEKTEQLAAKNVELAAQTNATAGETKELLKEVKDGLKEVKSDVREIKAELREVKEKVNEQDEGEGWKNRPE